MFYNIPSRRRALSKPGEEYARIVDVINKYAIHCQGISFSCKKSGDSLSSLSTNAKNTTIDNVRLVYGSTVANELLSFDHRHVSGMFEIRGLVTGANYRSKKFTCLLFINGTSTAIL
jgi:DNA mismatch repair protein MLH1